MISLAGAIQIVEPVRKWVFKTPHTDKMACEKIFADLKQRNLTTIALISGTDAFGKSMRDQCVTVAPKAGITVVARGILRSARQRHDAAAHQHQGQGRRAGGGQSRLRPGPGDRDAQLPPARHQRCRSTRAMASPPSSSSISPARPPTACGCRPPRCWSPTSCPTAIRRSRSSSDYKKTYRAEDRPAGLRLRRPCL